MIHSMDFSYQIIAETPHYLIVSKNHELPSVPLKNERDSDTLLSQVALRYPEILFKDHEGGVLHRLDNSTRGLVLIARTIDAYNYFKEEQKQGRFKKTYHALSTNDENEKLGYPSIEIDFQKENPIELHSSFRPYGRGRKEVRPVTEDSHIFNKRKSSPNAYTSLITYIGEQGHNKHLFVVTLTKGFRHQVRSHLAWASFPIIGDSLYGGKEHPLLHLIASKIQFYDYNNNQLREYSLFEDGINPFQEPLYKEKK
ncbi:MAG: RNA pseudouridine synthase [Spirochaetia bacterium]|nr:RNA pseudouridine synthase [Spirochaetia bacterium]